MPYRRSGETLEVRAAHGALEIVTTLEGLEVRDHLSITRDRATLATGEQLAIGGRVVVTQNLAHDDVGIWIELAGLSAMRRVFGAPRAAAVQVRAALRRHAAGIHAATELGRGRHRMLIVELADRHLVYASRLFREHSELVMTLHRDGRVALHHAARELSAAAIDIDGDRVRIVDSSSTRVAQFAFPWLTPTDRAELARRLSAASRFRDAR